jgi:hypothetical protein
MESGSVHKPEPRDKGLDHTFQRNDEMQEKGSFEHDKMRAVATEKYQLVTTFRPRCH